MNINIKYYFIVTTGMYTEILDCAIIRLTLANKLRVPTSSLGCTDRLENDNGYDYNTNNIGTVLYRGYLVTLS